MPALSAVDGPIEEGKALPSPKAARRGNRKSQIETRKSPEPVKQPFRQMLGGWGAVREVASPTPTPAPVAVVEAEPVEKPAKKKQAKNDPKLVAAARELRDRWLEAVNRGEFVALPEAKYEVARVIEDRTAQTESAIGNRPFDTAPFGSEPQGRRQGRQSASQRAPTLPSPVRQRSLQAGVPGEGSKIVLLPAA